MPPVKVKLSEILDGMEMAGEMTRAYLDTQTGKAIFINEAETYGLSGQ